MFEYTYVPERKTKKLMIIIAFLFFAAIILFGLTDSFEFSYEWGYQALALVCIVVSIFLLTRFVFKKLVYKVTERDVDSYDLVIDEVCGSSKISICRIALSNIERVEVRTHENSEELNQLAHGRKLFCYCPDLTPIEECWIFVTECGEELVIRIYADETLLSILKSAL